MGLFGRLKALVGAHGATTKMYAMNDTVPSDASLRLCTEGMEVMFDVSAEADVDILAHLVWLKMIREEGGRKQQMVVARASEEAAYTLPAGQSRRVTLKLDFDLHEALREAGIDPEDAVQNPHISWSLYANADVKGTALDAECRHDLALVGVEEEQMTGDGWATDPGPPEERLWLDAPDTGLGARACYIGETRVERVSRDYLAWVMTPTDGRGEITVVLPDPSDLHYSEKETQAEVVTDGVAKSFTYLGWVIVTYRVRNVLRGYFNGDLLSEEGNGSLFGTFEVQIPSRDEMKAQY